MEVDVNRQLLESNRNRVTAAGAGKRFSRERLEGKEKRFEAGLSQTYLVFQRQSELTTTDFTELQPMHASLKSE
jgi:outer membrane protein TolC